MHLTRRQFVCLMRGSRVGGHAVCCCRMWLKSQCSSCLRQSSPPAAAVAHWQQPLVLKGGPTSQQMVHCSCCCRHLGQQVRCSLTTQHSTFCPATHTAHLALWHRQAAQARLTLNMRAVGSCLTAASGAPLRTCLCQPQVEGRQRTGVGIEEVGFRVWV
jgi:hypothetical protein